MQVVEVHAERCTGCRLCELACSMEKTGMFDPSSSRIAVRFKGAGACIPVLCTQCEYEWCARACPVGAISRDPETGIVVIDPQECIQCGECVTACPFGAIRQKSSEAVPFKCDECGGEPACVETCPAEALRLST